MTSSPTLVARSLVSPVRNMRARQTLRFLRALLLFDLRRALRTLDADLPDDLASSGLTRVAAALARLHVEIDAACDRVRREES